MRELFNLSSQVAYLTKLFLTSEERMRVAEKRLLDSVFFLDEGEDLLNFLEMLQNCESLGSNGIDLLVLVELLKDESLLDQEVESFFQNCRVDIGLVHYVGEFEGSID